ESKLLAERAVTRSPLNYTILRPVVVYGPGVKGNVQVLLRLAQSFWPLPLAAFENRRSLLGLDNLIAAIEFTLATPIADGETYLVADPQPLTLVDIVATLRDAAGRARRLYRVPPRLIEVALTGIGRRDLWQRLGGSLVVDPGKLVAAGWRPLL